MKTALVLTGGALRGAAHIGVLEVLWKNHIRIDCIAGTSIGALIGSMFLANGFRRMYEDYKQANDHF